MTVPAAKCTDCIVTNNLFDSADRASGSDAVVGDPVFAGGANPDDGSGWALYQRTPAASSREGAMRAFEQALQIDPKSYDAKLGIASVLVVGLAAGSDTPAEDEARAEALLNELLVRDSNRSQLHAMTALLSSCPWR